jgi:hypothetical protein
MAPSDDDTPTPQQVLPDIQPAPDDDQTTGSLSGEDDPCRAQPEENGAQAGQKPDEGDDQQAGDTAALSDKLDACNGVLKPPPTGESEMVQPAPDIGETPVIPPGQLPEQQNSDPNARS